MSETPQYKAKIKIVEKRWHGWSPEGANIAPKETAVEKNSGSFLLIEETTRNMDGLWGADDQEVANMKRVDYTQREGFRLFISSKVPEKVDFTPEVRMKPIKGDEFPVSRRLPLKKISLKVGEDFEVKPQTMDAGVSYTISLLGITED